MPSTALLDLIGRKLVDGSFRGSYVEPHDVPELFDEAGVSGELEVPHPVGLEPMSGPDAGDLAVMESHDLGQQTAKTTSPT